MTQPTSSRIPESAAQLLAAARGETGIDIDDSEMQERLDHALQALNTQAQLSAEGALGMRGWVMRILRNRLRFKRDLANHPEILQQQIVRPLIMACGPRSGSTKMHKMLAAGGDFKVMYCWQGMCPALRTGNRIEDPTPRMREADAFARWFDSRAPKAKLIHHLDTLEIEEENLIFEHHFQGQYMAPFVNVPDYVTWYMATYDFEYEMRFLKPWLQYLQWQFHDNDPRPWLIKNPSYVGNEPDILKVFPDATLITTHRDPVKVVSSGNSLTTEFQKAYSDADFRLPTGPAMIAGIAATWARHVANRKAHPGMRILDIGYPDTTKHAEKVVERIYAHYGKPLSDRACNAMHVWEHENTQHKHGAHQHSLEGYGINEEMIRHAFRDYIAEFGAYL
jgi:Sulfotransferase family